MSAAKITMTASQARNIVRYIEPPPTRCADQRDIITVEASVGYAKSPQLGNHIATVVNDRFAFVIEPRQLGGFWSAIRAALAELSGAKQLELPEVMRRRGR
jgi:hypothetical protein